MKHAYKLALSYATEDQELVGKVFHYLKAEGISVFYAPAPECQAVLSGENQREIFYKIFGIGAEYVALFVSKSYLVKKVPMEEAGIAFAKHSGNGSVIPIYLDGSYLPAGLFDPGNTNYFKSNHPAEIAGHLAAKIKAEKETERQGALESETGDIMNIKNNKADKQIFIQTFQGSLEL